jgi:PAS domain S-box-containing protein
MKNYWSKLPTTYRGAIILSIPALCLVVTLSAWVWSWQRETRLNKQINYTEKAIAQNNELLIALLNAETGIRGYNISRIASLNAKREGISSFNTSRNEQFLEPYQMAHSSLPIVLSNLDRSITKSQQTQRMYLFKNLDRNLSEGKTLIQAIVTNVVDGIVTLTKQGKIETFNHAAAKMFGYEPDEVIGKNLTMLLAECSQDEYEEEPNLQKACQIELDRPWQTQGNRKIGQPFPIEISLSNMQFNDRSIAIIRDITERQQAAEKLKTRADELTRLSKILAQTNEELAEKNEELEQFAYVASHDLKAPLRAIANLSEWIEEDLEGQLPAENQRQMKLLRGRVYRLEALINALLEYYRAGRTTMATETVNINLLLTEIIDSLDPPATFKIEIQPRMPTLQTKRIPLSQVFSNLISNAIKYHHRSDGQIWISYQDLGEFYEFAVADDGAGIAPEHHERVFTIFQTLQSRDQTESTGIGLAIVKKIIEAEGGEISLESKLGEGATFRFTWLKEATQN